MIVVIDNYDSFTYNLVQYLGELGVELEVFRNDAVRVQDIAALQPASIVISPGPGDPSTAGISKDLITTLGPRIPLLGVCLGHQCIAEAFGGQVLRAGRLMHGKTSWVYHYEDALFNGVPSPFEATRYHSLIVAEGGLPEDLRISALTKQGEIMGLRHTAYPIYGVQFHPESILTPYGKQILSNFLTIQVPAREAVV